MPMWPFGRRGGKAAKLKGRSAAVADRNKPVAQRAHEFASSDALRVEPTRRSSRRRRRSSRSTASLPRDVEKSSPTLPPADQAYAKEKEGLRRASTEDDITALPNQKRLEQSPHLRPISQQHIYAYNFQVNSQSSLPTARERGRLQRPQSLRRSVNDSALIRRKSSKKQKREHDHVREEEIRAMSMPMPQKRPAGNSGGMLRRDSKKVKGGLNHRFERPTSNISLPLEESIHSSMSGSSDPRAFRVSALDMFSPRPTIRCSVGTQYYYSNVDTSPSSKQSRRDAQGRSRTTTGDTEDKRTSRIDDLADSLDAPALREILDRDKRRRDRKRRQEDERLRRRLERRAEKQKALEAGGTPATPRQDARGAIGLGIEKETSTPMEDVRPSTPQQPHRLETTALAPSAHENSQLPTPLESPVEEPVVSNAHAIRYSRGSVSGPVHSRGPSNISQMPELLSEKFAHDTPVQSVEHAHDPTASGSLHAVDTSDTAPTSKMSASRRRSSEGRRMGVFASLFRRSKRNSQDQGRTTPSEISFSNTSRESMSRHPLPAHLVAAPSQPVAIKRPSSVPRRTMSKFREDLPEFPLSPPDSRVQSPEVTIGGAIASRRRSQQPADLRVESNSSGTGPRTDSPVSPGVPNAGLMSQSLASVDSEGSWLSGKPMNRRSNRSYFRSSVGSSSALKRTEDFNASYEELGVPDDEYFKRLTPQPDEHRFSPQPTEILATKTSSTALANEDAAVESGDEEAPPAPISGRPSEEEELVHTIARQPTVVHRQPRVKSTEALLSFFQAEKIFPEDTTSATEPTEGESPTSDDGIVTVQRAKSVDFGKNHVRHLSAGSAKLLDIQKRGSISSQSKLPQQK
ncbi:hypothetical protein K458DRAFT_383660 [Lentithecium fluviatile CBS 122367]|uniref:Uncharacterized protein n=1 Tax=Lentithecium fluviatile CBS 122367 TaxID=1168545 RepID=A0A6G1JK89_9PLEO|nr:hypothetical protein K458DRAFT_383660 [Lentithecium fluviatile CBS 122367]